MLLIIYLLNIGLFTFGDSNVSSYANDYARIEFRELKDFMLACMPLVCLNVSFAYCWMMPELLSAFWSLRSGSFRTLTVMEHSSFLLLLLREEFALANK